MPLKSGETVDNVYVKVGEFFREYVQIYSLLLTEPIALGLNTSHAEKKKKKEMLQHQLFSWALGIEHCFTEIGNVLKMSVYSWIWQSVGIGFQKISKEFLALAKEHSDLDYVFADVNCRLKVVFKDSASNFFNDIDNLKSMINYRS